VLTRLQADPDLGKLADRHRQQRSHSIEKVLACVGVGRRGQQRADERVRKHRQSGHNRH